MFKASLRVWKFLMDVVGNTPKPGALPTGPHPDIELKKNARCGQICGQGNTITFLTNIQRR